MSRAKFQTILTGHYHSLFANDPEYAYAAGRTTPEALAEKMTASLLSGSANKDGAGIKRTCKDLGIKYTYTAIQEYLARPEDA